MEAEGYKQHNSIHMRSILDACVNTQYPCVLVNQIYDGARSSNSKKYGILVTFSGLYIFLIIVLIP